MPKQEKLRQYVKTTLGTLHNGVKRENWEHACREITCSCVKDVGRGDINSFVKHAVFILTNMIRVAFEDVTEGNEVYSERFSLLPEKVETLILRQNDTVVEKLAVDAAAKIHVAAEPMYWTMNPAIITPEGRQSSEFFAASRSSMITDDEISVILLKVDEYLQELIGRRIVVNLEFFLDYYLFYGSKGALVPVMRNKANKSSFDEIKPNPILDEKISYLEKELEEAQALIRGLDLSEL